VEHQRPVRRFANREDPNHIAAPMPGVISSVIAELGQKVKRGDTLLSIEAMKMETAVIANKDGIIDEMVASVGEPVDAKDLLVVLKG
jgi:pyruvate carboxylase